MAGEVTMHYADLVRDSTGGIEAALTLPETDPGLPIVDDRASDAAAGLLRDLDAAGRAHGFAGILYDNRDRGHSRLRPQRFPRLVHLHYGFELIAAGTDYGLAGAVLLPAVVVGNSSTAITGGDAPRSLMRLAMTRPGQAALQARLYAADHIYVYPEHRDHDDTDLYPANWPYMITSQGSSGSDRPFLEAIAMTLAAFPPETFALLRDHRLVAPTLQMILRRNLVTVTTPEDYLSGAAHPVVFDAGQLDPAGMVATAAALRPDGIPPLVRIAVEDEDFLPAAGLAGLDERLFDTPSAIARIWRGFDWDREMILAAEAIGPEGPPVRFSWRLLQGDPERVLIEPLDADGRRARIRLKWHDAYVVQGQGGARLTSRVDIGVFAMRGDSASAPAILSVSFPTHELRTYGPSEDGGTQLLGVDYDAIAREAAYDPVLHWSAPWVDRPVRDASSDIVAWRRRARDGTETEVPHAEAAVGARYRLDRSDPGLPALVSPGRTGP